MRGSVTGGQKAKQALREIGEKLSRGGLVKVGFLNGATEPDWVDRQGRHHAGGQSVAQVAFWNEYGTTKSLPRPFFRTMIADGRKHWDADLANLLKNDIDPVHALGMMGDVMAGELRASIRYGEWAANAPSTVAMKGFSSPLINTGTMWREGVSFEVEE
jgi:hypothetical protein